MTFLSALLKQLKRTSVEAHSRIYRLPTFTCTYSDSYHRTVLLLSIDNSFHSFTGISTLVYSRTLLQQFFPLSVFFKKSDSISSAFTSVISSMLRRKSYLHFPFQLLLNFSVPFCSRKSAPLAPADIQTLLKRTWSWLPQWQRDLYRAILAEFSGNLPSRTCWKSALPRKVIISGDVSLKVHHYKTTRGRILGEGADLWVSLPPMQYRSRTLEKLHVLQEPSAGEAMHTAVAC